jgi:hypothetical protein
MRSLSTRFTQPNVRRNLVIVLGMSAILGGMPLVGCSRSGSDVSSSTVPGKAGFRVDWALVSVPDSMARGATVYVQATFRNVGDKPIATENLSVSYHWFTLTPSGPVQAVWDGVRTPVTVAVAPGSSYSTPVKVAAPDKPGDYLLVLDLVRDGVSWFGPMGAPTSSHNVKIS